MRALALALLVVGCKHEPEQAVATEVDPNVVAGQLIVTTVTPGTEPTGVLSALALDGYAFTYVDAASEGTHLLKVARADGSVLTAAETVELVKKLEGRPGLKAVELNRVRQPR